ncbi:MAG: imidazole glycerol phosphate synthase subunit HisF [Firmicutes bacterium]|nr:imidazole glycerol phosphate synthase subunit HisF [Bacillota bacterium]
MGKRIIPCLDVKNGRVVKGTQFTELRDAGDPVELAALYEQMGADEIVFLDISASVEGRKTLIDMVKRTAENISIPFIVGGGIKEPEDIEKLLEAGSTKVSINTAAVVNPELIKHGAKIFGSERLVIAIDAKKIPDSNRWKVCTHGGTKETDLDVVDWALQVESLGAGEILLTSMDADGTKEGFDLAVTRRVAEAVKIPVIASGGAGKLEHFRDALTLGKADAALAASLFHFKELTIQQVKQYLVECGVW